jgi:hypothetical protein
MTIKSIFMDHAGVKSFVAMALGTVMQWISSIDAVQWMGFVTFVSGLVVAISAVAKNHAEKKKSEAEEQKIVQEARMKQEEHAAKMWFMKRDMKRNGIGDSNFGELS